MAKVKKMAFGGMGSRPPMGGMRPGMGQAPLPRNGVQMPMGIGIGNATRNAGPTSPPNMAEAMANTEMMKKAGFSNPGGTPTGQNALNTAMQNASTVNNMVGAAAGAGRPMKKGGKVKSYAKGGTVSSASKRADGIATKGKTRGTMIMCGGGMAKGKK